MGCQGPGVASSPDALAPSASEVLGSRRGVLSPAHTHPIWMRPAYLSALSSLGAPQPDQDARVTACGCQAGFLGVGRSVQPTEREVPDPVPPRRSVSVE